MRNVLLARRYLQLRSFDTSTVDGRASERYRRAAWAAVSNVGSRGLSMLLVVLAVHLTVPYLGPERFGVWATFASMAAMLSLLDLGVGNALVNRIAQAAAKSDAPGMRRTVTGGAGILAVIGVAAGAALLLVASVIPWGRAFKLTDAVLVAEAEQAGYVFAAVFGLNLFSSGLLRILAGQQRSHVANLVSGLGTALACLALFAAADRHSGIGWLIGVTFGVQTVVGLSAGGVLVRSGMLRMRGSWAAMNSERPHLLKTGSLFIVLQLGTMLGWSSDSLILASLQGAGEVAVYAVAMRLFLFASQPFAVINAPLWAAYADACARHDTAFIRITLKRSLLASFLGCSAVSCLLFFAAPALIARWTHETIAVPTLVLALFAGWTVLEASGNAFGTYLNGCGIVRQQVWVVLAFCAVVLPLKVVLGATWGAAGILAASIFAYVLVVVGLYATVFRARVLLPLGASA